MRLWWWQHLQAFWLICATIRNKAIKNEGDQYANYIIQPYDSFQGSQRLFLTETGRLKYLKKYFLPRFSLTMKVRAHLPGWARLPRLQGKSVYNMRKSANDIDWNIYFSAFRVTENSLDIWSKLTKIPKIGQRVSWFSRSRCIFFFIGAILAEDYLSGKDLTFRNTLLTTMKEKLQNR